MSETVKHAETTPEVAQPWRELGLKEDEYALTSDNHLMETRPYASNVAPGARTRREVWKSITEGPWSP